MSISEDAAIRIMDSLHEAERDLVGRDFTVNGEPAGFIQAVRLDDVHGLKVTSNHLRWHPLSTIVLAS